MKKALFIILNDYADWEGAYLSSQLNQDSNWQVKNASVNKTVKSIGGFTTLVDMSIDQILPNFDLLILIGGNSWNLKNDKLVDIIKKALSDNVIVGAICGAVDFLAKNGLLTNYKHTGNAQFFWNDYKNYINSNDFYEKQVIKDRNLVTANGTAPLDFTELVLQAVKFNTPEKIHESVELYRLGFYEYCEKYGNPYK
ncbi:glutamine amidotransferase [Fructilactobacillus lindneri]|uniref:DJ-1 PfpI family protein n=2 Tax=Fructilactobacillus lindneri TaxID=53444 RepID=A0A0R2JWT6_9LACO|nr:type 1 glutamine amidotransferase family protein [Fructilactobacillus lindneri]ANZ57838.1 glutamine amidotransferase [Fructilactobacillus lindneri]ANZ59107.1 glutamine amidotransferase [Fructilactobacillus lindneri]KRN78708.1 DJ-1 PfpI family protein [Fructilactobacillus lindneri DSM 20690 = JCM 11027]POG98160.1 glutamine amidotransferase [Fructilactobacillus lindneri]POH01724.1 glutamine amidotransferase [Fructilactobacillus lindneri]